MILEDRRRAPLYKNTGSGSWPRGVEAVLDYDGYVLNDRRRADQVVVTGIGGLGGPDLQAGAEKDPDRDGESPLDATYGGRTITLRGYVKAGNLDRMHEMYSDLYDAFDVVRERPLWFRWLDWMDYFVDSRALIDYAFDEGEYTTLVQSDGSGLAPLTTAAKSLRIYPLGNDGTSPIRLAYADGEGILRFRAGTSMTDVVVGLEMRRKSLTQKLRVVYEHSTATLKVYKIDVPVPASVTLPTTLPFTLEYTSEHLIASTAVSPALSPGISYYLRVRTSGSKITYSIWNTYPPDIGGTPLASGEHTLSAANQLLYPSGINGLSWGMHWQPNSTNDRIEMLDVGAIDKGDAMIWCRKSAQIDPGEEEQTTSDFRRPFLITLRASDSRMVSRKVISKSVVPSGFALTFSADGSGLVFPADGSGLTFGSYLPETIVNLGRSPATMIVRLYGPMTSPVLLEPVTGRSIGVRAGQSIADGDYLEFDTSRRTVVDSAGASKYDLLTDETSWPKLQRGSNRLVLGADAVSGAGRVLITYRHSSR